MRCRTCDPLQRAITSAKRAEGAGIELAAWDAAFPHGADSLPGDVTLRTRAEGDHQLQLDHQRM